MSNPEHVAIIMKGVTAWNAWRMSNPEVKPDLILAPLAAHRPDGFFGSERILGDLRGVNFCRARLDGANLTKANLASADLQHASLCGALLRGATLTGANLRGACLRGSITFVTREEYLTARQKRDPIVVSEHTVVGHLFSGADLSQADLTGADFRDASLAGVNFSGATLRRARFDGAIFGATLLCDVDLRDCEGLDTVQHEGPSTIGIDTMLRSRGAVSQAFLSGTGVPGELVVEMRRMMASVEPGEYYSCFIAHSTEDVRFAEQLHARLGSAGVRCWFAPRDMKVGDLIRGRIDDSISVFDKVIVVLSAHSIQSPWVAKEVETAFERERRERSTVLFPLRLDDAVMHTSEAWAADIRRTRHIGDFRDWSDKDAFEAAFGRILRDLASSTLANDR